MASKLVAPPVDTDRGGSVSRAAADIRALIMSRTLLPGEQVRQEDLAVKIGTSRGPIREALQVLAVEGVVHYERNRGYFVTRFTADDLRQLYLIRDLLESEILRSIAPVSAETLAQLRDINARISAKNEDVQAIIELNSEFHNVIMEHSNLTLLRSELAHVGRMTLAYQSLSINGLRDWRLVASDHEQMIAALQDGDNELLVKLCREHRETTLRRLTPILS